MKIEKIPIENPYQINKMGTSGLREKQEVYNRPLFLEQFGQGIADYFTQTAPAGSKIIVGGDPRLGNAARVNVIARILAAAGFRVLIADNGLATTPAVSHAIRHFECAGGVILTASHNPFTDVGIKVNNSLGAPALEEDTSLINTLQNRVTGISLCGLDEAVKSGVIEYFDIIKLYADLLDSIFDFSKMKSMAAAAGVTAAFDSMHGAAGPFAREVFVNRIGLSPEMLREQPREDMGGYGADGEPLHPEPDFDYIPELIKLNSTGKYTIVGAWDSDVDRRLDGGSGFFIESADEFALFAKYSSMINVESLFDDTIYFCRSTVTADPTDRMEEYLGSLFPGKKVKTVETPTGFKWIAELGNWGVEESNGVGNPYLREKDGIFATVFLLKIILETGKTCRQLMEDIWRSHGRVYFTRGEVSGSETAEKSLLERIFAAAPSMAGKDFAGLTLESAGEWDYIHPVTGAMASRNAAWVLRFSGGNTVKARFSGTGSGGYTLRVYCTKFDKKYDMAKSGITRPMKDAFDAFLAAGGFPGKSRKYTDANQPDIYAGKNG
jgi:phosphoglucomutase